MIRFEHLAAAVVLVPESRRLSQFETGKRLPITLDDKLGESQVLWCEHVTEQVEVGGIFGAALALLHNTKRKRLVSMIKKLVIVSRGETILLFNHFYFYASLEKK